MAKSVTTDGDDTLSIAGGSLTVTANSALAGPLSMTGGSLTASGADVTLQANGTTSVTGASLYAKAGATLSLPNLTSYNKSTDTTFQATGTSSTLNLSALATLGNMSGRWTVQALAGGTLDLSGLAVINQPNAPLTFQADGAASRLDLSAPTSFTCQRYYAGFAVTHSGTVVANNLTSFSGVEITLDGSGTIATNQWNTLSGGAILIVTGGSYSMPGLTNVNNAGLCGERRQSGTAELDQLHQEQRNNVPSNGNRQHTQPAGARRTSGTCRTGGPSRPWLAGRCICPAWQSSISPTRL